MRDIFDAELAQLGHDLVAMSGRVERAITDAGVALLTADVTLAESVIAADVEIDAIERDLDERCVLLLRQVERREGDRGDALHRDLLAVLAHDLPAVIEWVTALGGRMARSSRPSGGGAQRR